MKKMHPTQQIIIGITGKLLVEFLGEDYKICDCPTCQKLKKIMKKADPYVKMVEKMVAVKKSYAHEGS